MSLQSIIEILGIALGLGLSALAASKAVEDKRKKVPIKVRLSSKKRS